MENVACHDDTDCKKHEALGSLSINYTCTYDTGSTEKNTKHCFKKCEDQNQCGHHEFCSTKNHLEVKVVNFH